MCQQCSAELKAQGASPRELLAASKRLRSKHHPAPEKEVEAIDLTGDDDIPAPPTRRSTDYTAQNPVKLERHASPPTTVPAAAPTNTARAPKAVIDALAQRAHIDPSPRALMAAVCAGDASADRLRQWNEQVALVKAQLEREKSGGKRAAEPAEASERPQKVRRVEEPVPAYAAGKHNTLSRQRPPQAHKSTGSELSVPEIGQLLHARAKTDAVLATALSNLVKGCATAAKLQLYHRVWDEIKVAGKLPTTSRTRPQTAQPTTSGAEAAKPASQLKQNSSAAPLRKASIDDEIYSGMVLGKVIAKALTVPENRARRRDCVPDILALRLCRDDGFRTRMERTNHYKGTGLDKLEYDMVVNEAIRVLRT
ncbi:hypothetical protein LTR85_002394 [Meristemomyces frigidus]|nr:hypothetical protein LTR85_002394 [Meristemomyces frigidus]